MRYAVASVFFLIILLSSPLRADNNSGCDEACWQEKRYLLEKQRIENQQKRFEQQMALEEKRHQEAIEKQRKEQRMQLLADAKKRCDSEDLNNASFDERNLCNAVKGYFSYGIPIPDALLGLND